MVTKETMKPTGRNFIGGLIEGINYPKGKKSPIINLQGCNDIIIVDRNYFLRNKTLLESWASKP
jgi:hypothetical protein